MILYLLNSNLYSKLGYKDRIKIEGKKQPRCRVSKLVIEIADVKPIEIIKRKIVRIFARLLNLNSSIILKMYSGVKK